jgi:hypothetical protein
VSSSHPHESAPFRIAGWLGFPVRRPLTSFRSGRGNGGLVGSRTSDAFRSVCASTLPEQSKSSANVHAEFHGSDPARVVKSSTRLTRDVSPRYQRCAGNRACPGIGNPAAQRRSVLLNLNRRRIPYLSCRGRRVDESVEESRSQFKTGGRGHWIRARTARPGGGDHHQPPKPGSCRHVSIDQNVPETVEVWKTATTEMWPHTCKKHLT